MQLEKVKELQLALMLVEEANEAGLWNQARWFEKKECGTVGCMAGTYAMYRGCEPIIDKDNIGFQLKTPNGEIVYVIDYVTGELGLEGWEADHLFDYLNTMDDLRKIVDELIENAE